MDDIISRQEAIDALNKRARDNFTLADGYQWYLGALHDVADDIRQLPSVQPRKGKWIDGMCSECEESTQGFLTNFCPNCGADMRGEQDD